MAYSTEVQILIQVVDQATKAIDAANKKIDELSKAAKESNKESEAGFAGVTLEALGLNQALELVKRGYEAVKIAVELPLEQFHTLFEVSSDLVKKYDEQYLAELRLETAARASGRASHDEVEEMKSLAESLEKTTRFEAKQIETGEGMALSLGATAKIMPQLTQAALDLATAAGTDVTEAFAKIDQAVQTGALRPGGIFGRLSIEVGKTGDAITDFLNVANKAEKLAGQGIAQQAGIGGAGPLIEMEHALEAVEREFGKIIANTPEWQAFLKTVTDIAAELGAFIQANHEQIGKVFGEGFAASIQLAVGAVKLFATVLTGAFAALKGLLSILDSLGGHFGIVSPFKAMGDELDDVTIKINQLKKEMNDPSQVFGLNPQTGQLEATALQQQQEAKLKQLQQRAESIRATMDALRGGSLSTSGFFGNLDKFTGDLDNLEKKAEGFGKGLLTVDGAVGQLGSNLADLATNQQKTSKAIGDWTETAQVNYAAVLKLTKEFLSDNERGIEIWVRLRDTVKEFAGTGDAQFSAVVNQLALMNKYGNINDTQFQSLMSTLNSGFDEAKDKVDSVDVGLKKIAQDARAIQSADVNIGIKQTTQSTQTTQVTGAAEVASKITTSLDNAAKAMSDAIVQAASKEGDAARRLSEASDAMVAANLEIKQGLDDSIGAMSDAAASMFDASGAVSNAAAASGSYMRTAANHLISAANDLVTASGYLDKSNRQGGFPGLAVGGLAIGGPTTRIIGEKPEAVIPLDARGLAFARALVGGAGDPGGGIQVDIHVGSLELSDRAVDDVVAKFQRKLADKMLESVRRR